MILSEEVKRAIREKYSDSDGDMLEIIVRELLELQEKHEELQTDYDDLSAVRDRLEYDISDLRDAINDIKD